MFTLRQTRYQIIGLEWTSLERGRYAACWRDVQPAACGEIGEAACLDLDYSSFVRNVVRSKPLNMHVLETHSVARKRRCAAEPSDGPWTDAALAADT